MILTLILRLTIWFLLTANLSLANILIGVAIAILLPRGSPSSTKLKDWLKAIWKILIAIPQAYFEAIEMVFRPHLREEVMMERVKSGRSPGLIFLDIFLITFTPKTIVLKYRQEGWFDVHYLRRGQQR